MHKSALFGSRINVPPPQEMLRRSHPLAIFLIITLFLIPIYWYRRPLTPFSTPHIPSGATLDTSSRSLQQEQCATAFPGLFDEIERAGGVFDLKPLPENTPGLVQGRIKDGKVYVAPGCSAERMLTVAAVHNLGQPRQLLPCEYRPLLRQTSVRNTYLYQRIPASLHALHRAIINSPTHLPDTVFALNVNDEPREHTWSFTRSDDDLTETSPFLMPHYSSWSNPSPLVGPLDDAIERINIIEKQGSWREKIDKVVWRGTKYLNPSWGMSLRTMLVTVAGGRNWADVEFSGEGRNTSIPIEDFCKYRYIVYAEVCGISSSIFL